MISHFSSPFTMSFLFWALTFFLLDHGALNLGDGKVAENPENIASITSKENDGDRQVFIVHIF